MRGELRHCAKEFTRNYVNHNLNSIHTSTKKPEIERLNVHLFSVAKESLLALRCEWKFLVEIITFH